MNKYAFSWDTITPDEIKQIFSKAPADAKYFAVDLSGTGWFYNHEPVIDIERGFWTDNTNMSKAVRASLFKYPWTNWEKSLLKRP